MKGSDPSCISPSSKGQDNCVRGKYEPHQRETFAFQTGIQPGREAAHGAVLIDLLIIKESAKQAVIARVLSSVFTVCG